MPPFGLYPFDPSQGHRWLGRLDNMAPMWVQSEDQKLSAIFFLVINRINFIYYQKNLAAQKLDSRCNTTKQKVDQSSLINIRK
uniref:Uncharacterized protein n=1 Tax=Nelumbo nucifera TaxID=4432 RepID=A0A822YBY9_NELNU|nr:TPA_asm: hypothetical protein HUJ06_030277 [Nelumbo nucifera]